MPYGKIPETEKNMADWQIISFSYSSRAPIFIVKRIWIPLERFSLLKPVKRLIHDFAHQYQLTAANLTGQKAVQYFRIATGRIFHENIALGQIV